MLIFADVLPAQAAGSGGGGGRPYSQVRKPLPIKPFKPLDLIGRFEPCMTDIYLNSLCAHSWTNIDIHINIHVIRTVYAQRPQRLAGHEQAGGGCSGCARGGCQLAAEPAAHSSSYSDSAFQA